MDSKLQEMLVKVIRIESQGFVDEALELITKLIAVFPDDQEVLFYKKAEVEYKTGKKEEALFDYLKSYECNHSVGTRDDIIKTFYNPYKDVYDERFNNNQELFSKYDYYYGESNYQNRNVYPIYMNETFLVYFSDEKQEFSIKQRVRYDYESIGLNESVIIENFMWVEDCKNVEEGIPQLELLQYKKPIFYIYDEEKWILLNMIGDIKPLIENKKSVIMIGKDNFKKVFEDDWFVMPGILFSMEGSNKYVEIMNEYKAKFLLKKNTYEKELLDYYTDEIVDEHIKSKNIKILFITSRYTTVLQYHARDMERAAKSLGYDTRLLIEKDDIFFLNNNVIFRTANDFKPDIIFSLDHFRYESELGNKFPSIVYVTWIQDPMSHILNKETPKKIGKRDYILNHLINLEDLINVNYPSDKMIDAPIPASSYKYTKYNLSEVSKEDIERYSSDICIVCHASDVEKYIEEYLDLFSDNTKEHIKKLLYKYIEDIDKGMDFFYTQNEFRIFIKNFFDENNIRIYPNADSFIERVSKDMYMWLNQRVYRQKMVDSLLKAGFKNIKLWGRGWEDNEKYAPYSMGVAENGKELSLIYQCSKIVLGNNIMTTAAARAWETMLSGGFYMSNYIPPEYDVCDIRKIMKEDEEIVIFKNFKDLADKVQYYLDNEDERKRMIELDNRIANEKMTFEVLCKKMIDFISK